MRQPTKSWKIYIYGGAFVLLLYILRHLPWEIDRLASLTLKSEFDSFIDSPLYGLFLLIPLAIVVMEIIAALSERFALMSREVASLASILFLSGFVVQHYELDLGSLISSGLLLLSLLVHLDLYEQNEAPHSHVLLGVLFFLLCVLDSRVVLYIPLWIITSFRMKSLSVKGLIAFGVGVLNPILILVIYWLSRYSYSNVLELLEAWFKPLNSPNLIFFDFGLYWDILLIVLVGMVAIFSTFWRGYHESIRQRAQYAVFASWLLYGLLLLSVYPSSMTVLPPLLAMSVLGARGICMLDKKIYRLSLCFLASISLTMSIFM